MKDCIAYDTETWLIESARVAPPIVLLSWADGASSDVLHRLDGKIGYRMHEILTGTAEICGQNLPYDMAVIIANFPELAPLVWAAYEADRCVDTMVRQKLIDIAHGRFRGWRNGATGEWIEFKYHLADLAKRHKYPEDLDKDTWRLRYKEFHNTPLHLMPEGAVNYSRHDGLSTRWVWAEQEADEHLLRDQYRQSRYHWALHLVSAWGTRTDKVMVDKLEELTQRMLDDHRELLLAEGLLEAKKDGSFTKKVKLAKMYAEKAWAKCPDLEPVLTEKGAYSLSEDAAKQLGDPIITAFQEFSSASTIMARVQELRDGITMPIHTRFDEMMATGRTSSSKPNIQARKVEVTMRASCGHKLDRKHYSCPQCQTPYEMAGDRESFVPRKGNVFYIWDVPGLELRTIAQKCKTIIGYSVLADVLNSSPDADPHILVGAMILGIDPEEAMRRKLDRGDIEIYLARQGGKIGNFGGDALIGPRGLVAQARTKYDLILTIEQAKNILDARKSTYPETAEFESWVKAICRGGLGDIEQLFVERYRGLVPPTEASNTLSQGLGADATKNGLYALVKANYIGSGLLYGCRTVNYVHDEYIMEGPEDDHMVERGAQMVDTLADAINVFLPDVPVHKEDPPVITRRWSKLANNKKAIPWEWDVAVALGSKGYAE